MVQDIVKYNNRIFNTTMAFLSHINAIVTFNTNKSTIGQSGPMVFVYMNKISWISKKSINSKKEGLLQTILHKKMEYTVG